MLLGRWPGLSIRGTGLMNCDAFEPDNRPLEALGPAVLAAFLGNIHR